MVTREMPTLLASAYNSAAYDGETDWKSAFAHGETQQRRVQAAASLLQLSQMSQQPKKEEVVTTSARIVQVFVADTNENLPLEKRVLYTGPQKLTDLNDQELFFEVPIADLIAKHNETRVKTIDKAQTSKFGRDIYLEPARIRDLKMVVVTVASF